jgi:hypothetical protein
MHWCPPRQQRVRVAALRHRAALFADRGQLVALDHRDAVIALGQHARGEQAGDAGPDHHGVVADPRHVSNLLVCWSARVGRGAAHSPGRSLLDQCSGPYSSRCQSHSTTRCTPRARCRR